MTRARWVPVQLPGGGADTPRADAYLSWAQANDFRDARPRPQGDGPAWIKTLLCLREGRTASEFALRVGALPQRWLWVPGHYALPPAGLEGTRYCTAIVYTDAFAWLASGQVPDNVLAPVRELLAWVREVVERFEIGFETAPPEPRAAPARDTRAKQVESAAEPAEPAGQQVQVVVGVIDDGLAFAHRRFCIVQADGTRRTRFLGLWDQGATRHTACHRLWGPGRLHESAQLDNLLAEAGADVDEDAVYQRAGCRDVGSRITHGTHVLDLACGADAVPGGPPLPHIVGVQLPRDAIEDTSCASMTPCLLDAVRYVLAQADVAAGRPCPVVVNCSLGNIAGPHDGSSLLESAIDEIIVQRRRAADFELVLSEGNSLLSQTHAWAEMEPDGPMHLTWRVRPDDGTSSFVELWFRPRRRNDSGLDTLAVELSLTPPGGLPAVTLTLDLAQASDGSQKALVAGGRTLALCGLHAKPANGHHPMALLTVAPTACYGPWTHRAPSGEWKLAVTNLGRPIYCNVYVQRDDVAFGRGGRGRQGVLDDGRYVRLDERGAPVLRDKMIKPEIVVALGRPARAMRANGIEPAFVRRAGTINGLATGKHVRVVGGVTRLPGGGLAAARYSAVAIPATPMGTQLGRRLAVTEDSALLHGVLAAGSRSGSVVALSGTSMAAPQWARRIAEAWLGGGVAPASLPARKASDANRTAREVLPLTPEQESRARRRRGE